MRFLFSRRLVCGHAGRAFTCFSSGDAAALWLLKTHSCLVVPGGRGGLSSPLVPAQPACQTNPPATRLLTSFIKESRMKTEEASTEWERFRAAPALSNANIRKSFSVLKCPRFGFLDEKVKSRRSGSPLQDCRDLCRLARTMQVHVSIKVGHVSVLSYAGVRE